MESSDEMSETVTGFKATLDGTAPIFDYFQLAGKHMPFIQFIAGYCMQVKHWSFIDMIKVDFVSDRPSNWTRCTFYFQDGRREALIVAQDDKNQFFVREEQHGSTERQS